MLRRAASYAPWWTKKTASQTSKLSRVGVTYMPSGQCPACTREAYSSATALRVSELVFGSDVILLRVGPVPDGSRDGPRERACAGFVKSMVGDEAKLSNLGK